MAEKKPAPKRMTKAQVVAELAAMTELDKKTVNNVFASLSQIIKKELGPRGPGEFVIPGLVKLKTVKKPATKDREGINPFTKEPMTIKGKPASKKVRATAVKALKDMVQ
ncbi:MAG: HU family DNA-binding protein [Myxococcota bacterium]